MSNRGIRLSLAVLFWAPLALVAVGCGDGPQQVSRGLPNGEEGVPSPAAAIRIALASVKQGADLPQLLAAERLSEQGYSTEFLELNGNYQGIQAVVSGGAEFGELSALSVMIAINKGAPLKILLWEARLDSVLAARSEIVSLKDLHGKRVGIFATVSNAGLALSHSLTQVPKVTPRVLMGSFSSARVAALMAGEMDAAIIQYPDWLYLQMQSGGHYHTLADYAREELLSRVVFAHQDFIAGNPELVLDYLAASVKAARDLIDGGPELVLNQLQSHLPEMEPLILGELARFYVEREVWPRDGGRSEFNRALRTTLTVGVKAMLLPSEAPRLSYIDCSFLNKVLQEEAGPTKCG